MHQSNGEVLIPCDSNCRLRAILVKLQDRLSDDDRKRLHFYFGDDVPRRIRDDQTLSGTFVLMESLIDQNKINETDSTYLINAFQVIGCHDLAKILREFTCKLRSPTNSSSSVGTIIDQILGEFPDSSQIQTQTKRIENEENITLISKGTNSSSFSESESGSGSAKSFKKNSHRNIFRVILSLLILVIISFGLSVYFNVKQYLSAGYIEELLKKCSEIEIKMKEKNLTIQSLQEEKKSFPLLYGKIYGLSSGKPFDDSNVGGFNSSFFLNGFESYTINGSRLSYNFIYQSTLTNSISYGEKIPDSDDSDGPFRFKFRKTTKMFRVTGYIHYRMIPLKNGTHINQTIIHGLEFESDDGEKSPTYLGPKENQFKEEYDGFSIYYVRGFISDFIHQIQFVWRCTRKI